MSIARSPRGGLQVATVLADLIETRILPGTGIEPEAFWAGFTRIVDTLTPRNAGAAREARRAAGADRRAGTGSRGPAARPGGVSAFLTEIGYLLAGAGGLHRRRPPDVDPEMSRQSPGRSSSCRSCNARYALNAANARWGILYDALYGTDAICEADGATRGRATTPGAARGRRRMREAFLDEVAPLAGGRHARRDRLRGRGRRAGVSDRAAAGSASPTPAQFVGYVGDADGAEAILLVNNGLHVEIRIDRAQPDRRDRCRRRCRRRARSRADDDPGLRGFGRRGRRRRQGRASIATGSA